MSTASPPRTIVVVDDDAAVRKALGRVLRTHGFTVETLDSAEAFLARSDAEPPACLVLDVNLPALNGLALQRRLVDDGASVPIIFLTGNGDIPMSVRAIKHGAVDFLTKPVNDNDLIEAIHDAIKKNRIARRSRAKLIELQQRLATLTPREREVLNHVVSSKRNRQIATELGTAEQTIKIHRASLMKKLKAESLADLLKLAERLGITSSPLD